MTDEDLNIKFICGETLLDKYDELVPIILDMLQDSYKAGLWQAKYDNNIDIIEENHKLKEVIDKIKKNLESSIESINQKFLDDKEIKVKNGKIVNMNDYQIVRLKAFRTKCKELLDILKEVSK